MTKADQLLLQRLRQGDEKAVAEWYRRFEPKIFNYILAKISSLPDAQELVQDTFLSCLQHLPLFRGEASILTWMRQIAQRRVASYYRKKYAKKIIKTLPIGDLVLSAGVYDAQDISQKVILTLARLSLSSAELLKLKYIDDKSVKQIARELRQSVKAVESALFRARIDFKQIWLQIDYDH